MFTWAIVGTLIVGAPALKVERKPVRPPAGEWLVERMECEDLATDYSGTNFRVKAVFTPTQWKSLWDNSGREFATPEQAAWFDADGNLEAEFWTDDPTKAKKAIWKVEGDTLTICMTYDGDSRPTDYTAPKGSHRKLWVYKLKGK
jgi:uncharacterized protein (TIGR03067 family)